MEGKQPQNAGDYPCMATTSCRAKGVGHGSNAGGNLAKRTEIGVRG